MASNQKNDSLSSLLAMNFLNAKKLSLQGKVFPLMQARYLFLSITTCCLLTMNSAHAQSPQVTPPERVASAASASSTVAPAPRYTDSNLERAFNFMDADHDGHVSREEAASFRGVARHFDQADTNHDGILSREEFGAAMNYVKPQ